MAWFDNNWLYRFKITSDETKIDEAIDNVYYDLANAPAGFWTHVKSDGGDIRVTQSDQITEVAREVSGFNQGSNLGSLFFKATGLSASSNVDFYIYYGNSAASEPSSGASNGKNNVWTSLLCVFHLDESASPVNCSKSNNTLTGTNATFSATGKLRNGVSFNGSTSRLEGGDIFDISAASFTFSAWINPTTGNRSERMICKVPGSDRNGYDFRKRTSGIATIAVEIADSGGFELPTSDGNDISSGVLQFITATYDGSNARFYVNAGTQGAPAASIVPTNGTSTFVIGNSSDAFDSLGFDGVIDEVRISNSVRSLNWIATEYNNQNSPSTFWTTGTEENVPIGGLPFFTILGAKRI